MRAESDKLSAGGLEARLSKLWSIKFHARGAWVCRVAHSVGNAHFWNEWITSLSMSRVKNQQRHIGSRNRPAELRAVATLPTFRTLERDLGADRRLRRASQGRVGGEASAVRGSGPGAITQSKVHPQRQSRGLRPAPDDTPAQALGPLLQRDFTSRCLESWGPPRGG